MRCARLLVPIALLVALAPQVRAETVVDCAVFGCGVSLVWNSSTVRLDLWSGHADWRVRSVTISDLPVRHEYPWDVEPMPYELSFGDCPPEGYCHAPFAFEYEPFFFEFLSHGWSLSGGDTEFTMTHPTGVIAQTLYLNDPISWELGPTTPWDFGDATVLAQVVTPEPVSLALLATGLLALVGAGVKRRAKH